ncbi:zinc finger CCCH-type with G patch domain-containing protein [Osmerus mordax]|uniref:zinc finger CCCH-type with G patch domain-containing protein n=1 Tax=Osmerus mordax TaxID=8014 RepID=UPI003510D059
MDEGTLEAAISAYEAQRQQVEVALSAGLDPAQQSDLLQLKEDLTQLIELTEASLVSVKKSRLLASLEEGNLFLSQTADDASATGGGLDNEFAAFYSEVGEVSGSSSDTRERGDERDDERKDDNGEEDEEEEDTLSGTKVRAPYRTSWGVLEYHNAMVVNTESPDEEEEAQVRVLYVHPTQKSMKPCPYFLEDKCRFLDDCRFSHGEVVRVSELRAFLEADLSNLQEGSPCLARHEDGIWYPARITDIDNGFFTVKFNSLLLKDAVLEADGVIPPMRDDDSLSSDSSEDEDLIDGEAAFARVLDHSQEDDKIQSSGSSFGGWEAHTRGIGSKLMLKMGYEYGKGLGKTSEGRVEPVLAVVLPKGKSLDQCAELTGRRTQSKTSNNGEQVANKKRRRKRKGRAGPSGGRRNVFDFLNRKLGDGGADGGGGGGGGPAPAPSQRGSGVEAYRGGKNAKRSLNVKVFQAAERVTQTEREIQRLTESLRRRSGRDVTMVSHLEERLSAARSLLTQQKAQEISIQRENRKADTHKKMTEF